MIYAYPTNRVFSSVGPVKKKTVLTDEMKQRRNFINSHRVVILKDSETGKVSAEILENNVG